jgi:hypothetical protein
MEAVEKVPTPMNRTSLFVWSAWALLLICPIVYVVRYGSNVPSWDEWDMVPSMTGNQPVTASWLWSQHNEHRIPLARLLMLGIYRLRPDFRAAMFVNVFLMAALSALLTRCAQQIRGRPFYADVFMPLVLLGFAHGANFIWGWQVEFFASTALAGCVLLIVARPSHKINLWEAAAVAVCLLLLGISGAHGLAVVPFSRAVDGSARIRGMARESPGCQAAESAGLDIRSARDHRVCALFRRL